MRKTQLILFITSFYLLSFSLGYAQNVNTPVNSLNDLLQRVIANKNTDSAINEKRVKRFLNERNQQAALLEQAKNEQRKLEAVGDEINKQIAANDRTISALNIQLNERLGNFGELFGVTRQVAQETHSQIKNSLISVQFPGREASLEAITQSKALPTIAQLHALWVTLLQEQTEQGRVTRFNALVKGEDGTGQTKEVIRLGPFSAISGNKFLTYDTELNHLQYLERQPGARYTRLAKQLVQAEPGTLVNSVIDPSSGAILSMLVQTPNLVERYKQGGLPGYVITVLAIIGILIGLQRLISLWLCHIQVSQQMNSNKINTRNPLGRILKAYKDNSKANVETLELKLNDAILKEVPKLDRGLNTLKVLAAIAPLMGLLGTVIGMILTFQAITLWGTGEPKLMAGGISQALVTTVQGLIAAIPLLLLHSLANGQARLVQQVLEEQSAGLIALQAEKNHG